MIGIIAAVDYNGLIGYDNKLPWHAPEDLKRFKEITLKNNVVMGRKTYESIGKPLPNRNNFIITSNFNKLKNIDHSCICHSSLEDVLLSLKNDSKDTWVIGGASIFEASLSLNLIEVIDLTIIEGIWEPPNADANKCVYFPRIPFNFSVSFEKMNANDNKLLHRRYILR